MWELDEERLFRDDIFEAVFALASENDGTLSRSELGEVKYAGRSLRLIDPQGGIWNPGASWPFEDELRATLSINTTLSGIYEDKELAGGMWRYDYQSGGSGGKNTKLRKAMELQLPLLWFRQESNGRYVPYKVYVIEDYPDLGYCLIAPDRALGIMARSESVIERKYAERLMKQRLHQPAFRARVLDAYEIRCAVCRLNHGSLLDAAHITPDRDESSSTSVTNGLSLCKIHHRAYDIDMIGIDANYQVHVRKDILIENDGPMLEHGIKAMDKTRITVPTRPSEQPDRDRLDARFKNFSEKN